VADGRSFVRIPKRNMTWCRYAGPPGQQPQRELALSENTLYPVNFEYFQHLTAWFISITRWGVHEATRGAEEW